MNKIPKIIHYCWFGRNPLPELAVKCIDSWKKYFPDYKIKEWNESNFDFNACDYAREAYQEKKWAFVSDYARFKILYEEGGLYFDTDVEVIKSFSDIISRGAFMGCEKNALCLNKNVYDSCSLNGEKVSTSQNAANPGLGLGVAPGLGPGVAPGLGLYKEILDYYERQHFLCENGAINVETVVQKTTQILLGHDYNPYSGEIQKIADVWIYPPDYFCPMDYNTGKILLTENTHSIHHYSASWFSWADKMIIKIGRIFAGKGGMAHRINRILDFPFRVWAKLEKLGFKNTIDFIRKKLANKFGNKNK